MLAKIKRLFVIKTRLEACAVTYALALGAAERGQHYLALYPGLPGKLLYGAASIAVIMAGARIFDALKYEQKLVAEREAQAPIVNGSLTPATSAA